MGGGEGTDGGGREEDWMSKGSRLNVIGRCIEDNEEWFPKVQSVYDHRVAVLDDSPLAPSSKRSVQGVSRDAYTC